MNKLTNMQLSNFNFKFYTVVGASFIRYFSEILSGFYTPKKGHVLVMILSFLISVYIINE